MLTVNSMAWWCYAIEMIAKLLPLCEGHSGLVFCEGNPPVTSGFPSQSASNMELWCFFVDSPNRLLEKDSKLQWSETWWCLCDFTVMGWGNSSFVLFNSLAPGKFELNFRHVIFKPILVIDGWDIPCEIALLWMSLDITDDQSSLVLVMAWCRQATSHYLSQCWPRSLSPFGVTRPQWFKWKI